MSDFDHVEHAVLRRLVAYWLDIRGARRMPSRRDIDPVEIPWALPYVWLTDYLPNEDKFRYRLAGEDVNAVFGRSLAGASLDDIVLPQDRDAVHALYRRVLSDPAILYTSGHVYLASDKPALGERIALPLATGGDVADGMFGATIYELRSMDSVTEDIVGRHDAVFTPI